ncbi:MAG: hypothetical protein AAGF92_05855 [Myxococcota bacterium]
MHREIEPAVHIWGTPVVLVGPRNHDGTDDIAPMSSAWWGESRLHRNEDSLYETWKQRRLKPAAAAVIGANARRQYRLDDTQVLEAHR